MTLKGLTAWAERTNRSPRYFARFQALFVGVTACSVIFVVGGGGAWAWAALVLAVGGFTVAVRGEVRARRLLLEHQGGDVR